MNTNFKIFSLTQQEIEPSLLLLNRIFISHPELKGVGRKFSKGGGGGGGEKKKKKKKKKKNTEK